MNSDEAAWRELIARYDAPADTLPARPPWPEAEDLPDSPASPQPTGSAPSPGLSPGSSAPPATPPASPLPDGPLPDGPPAGQPLPGSPLPPASAGRARIVRSAAPPPQPPALADSDRDRDDGDRYIPPPPPPLPALDPLAKGAWAALCGGPAYLLIATFLGWQIPSWAALLAVAAFIGGFAIIILRMNDRPPSDDDPHNGAVL